MNILIPYDIDTTGIKNPYLFLLMRELANLDKVNTVQSGYGWLYENIRADVIHLHWPELLVKSKLSDMSRTDLLKPGHFTEVINALEWHKSRGAKIVITIHNEQPHKDKTSNFTVFYRQIYNMADGFIHMGQASREIISREHGEQMENKAQFVIPHGNYEYFENNLDRRHCRKTLGIEQGQKLLLTFGAVRSADELDLSLNAFRTADVNNSVLLMAGKLPYPYKSQPQHFIVRKKLYAGYFNKRIRTVEKAIAPDEVQVYMNAADLLLLPRFNTLNSGNVALGFTFGRVVAGPDYGVIGETLKQAGNPVFDPYHIVSVAEAIRAGFDLAESGLGAKNRQYALDTMNWHHIAEQTIGCYQTVMER